MNLIIKIIIKQLVELFDVLNFTNNSSKPKFCVSELWQP